ncbi:MFS transporter [Mycolicibacter arupensis]|uniref:MFS transporter n=1 Tax=Mycolicibacter arupensis TaxID=342002 RepID=A0A0F5N1I3_9MYCO|nr:MFS transporter [Mycolicibacter arupensis]KKC00871.1 MFS transporter permease [Mycolicibacter arupensis]MCV7274522.1 MFS transporter [Mycolicibacter arupensis]OQZ99327.1 MFS transporter [Mycolicibacter arupensis]
MRVFADTTPLRSPDFRRLWVAGIPTVIGANLTIFAVPVQIYALTRSSAYVGLAGLFALVPLVVFGLLGGAWADAMDRRKLLIIASGGLAVASVLLWMQAAAGLNNVWIVLGLLALQQGFYAVNAPTRSAAIPRLVAAGDLPAANALNMTVMQFGAIVGPLLAGLLLGWVDLSTLYLIDAATCLVPIWATLRLSPMPPSDAAGPSRFGIAAVLDGFRYLAGNTVVLMSFVVDLIAMVLGMPRALFPQIATADFGGPVEGGTTIALLAAAMSAGAVLGGVFSGWLPRISRQGLAIVVAISIWGMAMVGFGYAVSRGGGHAGPALWAALAMLAVGGAADMVSAAFRSTILQQVASDEIRGRLQGVFIVVVAGGPRLADAVHGAAGAVVGTAAAAAGGGVLVVVGVVLAALAAPAFLRYRRPVEVRRPPPSDDR